MPTSTYQIYKYTITAASERSLIAKDGRTTLDRAQEELERILATADLRAQKQTKDGAVPLDLSTECRQDGITVMVLCNEKTKNYKEKLEERQLEYHPGCRIIIDNRPEHGLMAIERSSSFESKPDKVRDILAESLNAHLADLNLEISIRPQAREDELWNIVEDMVENYGDTVRGVTFNFPNPRKQKMAFGSRRIKAMIGITSAMNAKKASLHVEAEEDEVLLFDQTVKDCAEMALLCLKNGYDLTVRFKKYGILRYGGETSEVGPAKAEVRVLTEITEEELLDFRTGQRKAVVDDYFYTYDLVVRLDAIMNTVKTCKDARPPKKTRKKRSARKAG